MKDHSNTLIHCPNSQICTACPQIYLSWQEQKIAKIQHWQNLLSQANISASVQKKNIFLNETRLRHKLDFVIEGSNCGLWSSKTQNIIDLPTCELLVPELSGLYSEFRKIKFSFQKN